MIFAELNSADIKEICNAVVDCVGITVTSVILYLMVKHASKSRLTQHC